MPKTSLDIKPLAKKETLAEQIVPQLMGLIQSGALKPGDKLPGQRDLAEKLGIGRPTLREALRALQLLGVLDIRHGGGVYVSSIAPDTLLGPLHLFVSFDKHSLETILEARKVIEGAVLATVAATASEDLIKTLQLNMDQLALALELPTDEQMERLNSLANEFRAAIEGAIANPILIRSLHSLNILSNASRHRLLLQGSPEILLKNHQLIIQALIDHDPAAAQRALETHIDYLYQSCESIE